MYRAKFQASGLRFFGMASNHLYLVGYHKCRKYTDAKATNREEIRVFLLKTWILIITCSDPEKILLNDFLSHSSTVIQDLQCPSGTIPVDFDYASRLGVGSVCQSYGIERILH